MTALLSEVAYWMSEKGGSILGGETLSRGILAHAQSLPAGSAIRARDLTHLGGRAAVDQALSRLARRGHIHRSGRGLYTASRRGDAETAPEAQTAAWQAKRRSILTVASKLFGERGFDRVSMRDIASPAKIHMATLYHYFPDKQALYTAVVREAFEVSARLALSNVDGQGAPAERIRAWAVATIEFLLEASPAARLIDRETLLSRGGSHPVPQEAMVMSRIAHEQISALLSELSPPILGSMKASRVGEMLRSVIYGAINQRGVFQGIDPDRRDLEAEAIKRDVLIVIAHILGLPASWAAIN